MGQDPSVELKPSAYAPKSRAKARVVAAFECRRLAREDPDPHDPALTGRYEDDAEAPNFTLNVNQAGKHVECWMAEVLTAETRRSKNVYRFAGDLQDDGSYRMYAVDDPKRVIGSLTPEGSDGLALQIQGAGTSGFERVNGYSTLSEKAMERLPPDHIIVKAYELTPLPTAYLRWLGSQLNAEKLGPVIDEYFDIGTGVGVVEDHERAEHLRAFADYIAEVFSTAPPKGWHPEDLLLARHHGQQILALERHTRKGVKRSLLDWIQIMLSRVAADGAWDKGLEPIREHLGLEAETDLDPDSKGHEYGFEIAAAGLAGDVGIGLGGFVGGITIEKKSDPGFREQYDFWMGGVSGGASIGVAMGFYTTGTGLAASTWAKGDFPGWYTMVDAGGHIGVGVGGGAGGTAMMIYGSKNHPPMAVDLGNWSARSEIGIGVEVGGSFGRIGDLKSISGGYEEKDALHVEVNDDYTVDAGLGERIHFRLGSALLNPAAWQLLRVFCAKELTALRSAGSRLTIVGHADRRDTEQNNLELTDLRAKNTLQAIRDILGPDLFKIADEHIELIGMGEQKAKEAGDRDRHQNPKWRKVQVILNSRLVVTLRGG